VGSGCGVRGEKGGEQQHYEGVEKCGEEQQHEGRRIQWEVAATRVKKSWRRSSSTQGEKGGKWQNCGGGRKGCKVATA